MSAFDHRTAVRRIGNTMLGTGNRRVTDYWLTQWRGDALPSWPEFDRTPIAELEPGLAALELRSDDTLIGILCGTAVRASLGLDLIGKNWLNFAPDEHRAERLKGYRQISAGAVGHCMRYGNHRSGAVHCVEEVLLPFAPLADGACPVLVHIGWRPVEAGAEQPEFLNSRSIPDEIALIPLTL